ncbi:MAG TPA: hypothetical protein VE465_28360 [Streptosporangiaceae bacterium]|nr:hypothetical protein [Streptosporangiaceae bacterium]
MGVPAWPVDTVAGEDGFVGLAGAEVDGMDATGIDLGHAATIHTASSTDKVHTAAAPVPAAKRRGRRSTWWR